MNDSQDIMLQIEKKYRYWKPMALLGKNKILAFHSMKIWVIDLKLKKENEIAIVQSSLLGKFLSKTRFFTRILRLEPRCCIGLGEGKYLFSFQKKLYRVDIHKKEIIEVYTFRQGMNHCQSFCLNGNCVYFGDYMQNPDKKEIFIYKYNCENDAVEIVYSFKSGEINHIHEIVWDKYRERFWIFTGDEGNASGIWYTDDDFCNVNEYMRGEQRYRVCISFVEPNFLVCATDTPYEQNYVFRINVDTKEIQIVSEINGPAIYGTSDSMNYYWATSVEGDTENRPYLRSLLGYKKAKGIIRRETHFVRMNKADGEVNVLARYQKDYYPIGLFQFGEILFADNLESPDTCVGYGQSLRRLDGYIIVLKKGQDNDN